MFMRTPLNTNLSNSRKEWWHRWLLHISFEQHSWQPVWRSSTLLPIIPGAGLCDAHIWRRIVFQCNQQLLGHTTTTDDALVTMRSGTLSLCIYMSIDQQKSTWPVHITPITLFHLWIYENIHYFSYLTLRI